MNAQTIRHELLSIQALRQRRNEYLDAGNQKKANQATAEAIKVVNTLQEKLGFDVWTKARYDLLSEYNLIGYTSTGYIELPDTNIDWCEEFRKSCNR